MKNSKILKRKKILKILLNNKKNKILNNKKILIKIRFYIKILFRYLRYLIKAKSFRFKIILFLIREQIFTSVIILIK